MIALGIESSRTRGMGHLFRSLLYVKYLENNNIEYIYLINNDEKSLDVLKKNNISYVLVDYEDTTSKWESKLIEKYEIDIWINDKFETSIEMAKHIKEKNVYFALIDDIGEAESYADINYIGLISFSKDKFGSKSVIDGMKYVILNDEIEQYKHKRNTINKLIVSFGGSDPFSNTIPVVKRLLDSTFEFDVTVGPNYTCEEELNILNSDKRFRIYKNVPSLIKLFNEYDLAITGGGVTCCEANAAGLPCVIIANAPHEVNTAYHLQKLGGCIYAGDYNGWNKDIIDIINGIDIATMSERGMKVFDTKAIERIFGFIIENYSKKNTVNRKYND